MKYYDSYMERQEVSPELHERLLNLEVRKKSAHPWLRYGALAACAALIIGAGVWKLAPQPQTPPAPNQSAGQFAADYTPLPGETDVVDPDDLFVVQGPANTEQFVAFYMMPSIDYREASDAPQMAFDIALPNGAFSVDLTKEDIQRIFWGPEGKPETAEGDLPWSLFWTGYTLNGSATYDGQGKLWWLTIRGEREDAAFRLELCPGMVPPACCVSVSDRGVSEFRGVEITAWNRGHECGSEFMTENGIGVRFENWIDLKVSDVLSLSEYDEAEDIGQDEFNALVKELEAMRQDELQDFNTLFIRQVLTEDGGLYLDHLMTNVNIPAWREESFDTLAQARQEADFAPYLPTMEPEGYSSYTGNKEFHGNLSYQEGVRNRLFVRWSRGYDNVEVCVYRDGYYPYDLVDPAKPESYDLRLYSIPWCDSVPEEYRETVNDPAFRAEDMSLEIVEARGREHDTGGMTYSFDVLHPDGTLVSYRCDGLTARQVWAMVEETL